MNILNLLILILPLLFAAEQGKSSGNNQSLFSHGEHTTNLNLPRSSVFNSSNSLEQIPGAPNLELFAKRSKMRKNRRAKGRSESAKKTFYQGRGVKLRAGILTGYLGGFIPIFSADYVQGFGGQASWMAGGLYTNVAGIISIYIFDGGATYHFVISDKMTFEVGGRAGLYLVTINFLGYEASYTTFGIIGQVGFNYQVSKSGAIGVDGMIPLGTLGGVLPLFTYRFILD